VTSIHHLPSQTSSLTLPLAVHRINKFQCKKTTTWTVFPRVCVCIVCVFSMGEKEIAEVFWSLVNAPSFFFSKVILQDLHIVGTNELEILLLLLLLLLSKSGPLQSCDSKNIMWRCSESVGPPNLYTSTNGTLTTLFGKINWFNMILMEMTGPRQVNIHPNWDAYTVQCTKSEKRALFIKCNEDEVIEWNYAFKNNVKNLGKTR
jgi:hypothetical protein